MRELENLVERTARLNLHPGVFHAPDVPSASVAIFAEPSLPSTPPEASGPPAPEGVLRAAGEALGLAHKTVLKLLPPEALVALGARADGARGRARRSARGASGRLRARRGCSRCSRRTASTRAGGGVAAALGTSRTTLIKLMDDLELPRAADLGADEIARAREAGRGRSGRRGAASPGVARRPEEAADLVEPQSKGLSAPARRTGVAGAA